MCKDTIYAEQIFILLQEKINITEDHIRQTVTMELNTKCI